MSEEPATRESVEDISDLMRSLRDRIRDVDSRLTRQIDQIGGPVRQQLERFKDEFGPINSRLIELGKKLDDLEDDTEASRRTAENSSKSLRAAVKKLDRYVTDEMTRLHVRMDAVEIQIVSLSKMVRPPLAARLRAGIRAVLRRWR